MLSCSCMLSCMNFIFLFNWTSIQAVTDSCSIAFHHARNVAEEPLPSANKNIELPRYFKTDTDGEVILVRSTFLESVDSCVYDVTTDNSEHANNVTLYWNRKAILLKVNTEVSYRV